MLVGLILKRLHGLSLSVGLHCGLVVRLSHQVLLSFASHVNAANHASNEYADENEAHYNGEDDDDCVGKSDVQMR